MLRVSVNLKQGVYIISEDDGKKEIRLPMSGQYDKATSEQIRRSIETRRRMVIPKEKIDTGVYNSLSEFDKKYGTNYSDKYIDVIKKDIQFTGVSEKNKDYKKRVFEKKAKEFADAGIEVQYNVSVFGGDKSLSFGERIQAIRQAFLQKQNGVNVQFSNSKKPLLGAPAGAQKVKEDNPAQITPKKGLIGKIKERFSKDEQLSPKAPMFTSIKVNEDDIPPMPDDVTLQEMRRQDKKSIIQQIPIKIIHTTNEPLMQFNPTPVANAQQPNPIAQPQPNATPVPPAQEIQIDPKAIEGLLNQNQRNIDEMVEAAKAEGLNPTQIAEPPKPDKQITDLFEGRRVASERITPKKKISRSKARQASKQALRDAGKLKNSYQDRIDAKEQRRQTAERLKAQGPTPKKQKTQQQQAQQQQPNQQQEQTQQPNQQQKRVIATSSKGAKAKEGSFITRLTRKIKGKDDSIRNKKFISKLSNRQKKIALGVTVVTAIAAIGLISGVGTYKLLSHFGGHTANIDKPINTPGVVETVKPSQDVDKDGIDYILGEYGGHTDPVETPAPVTPAPETPAPEIQKPVNNEQQSKEEYLSSIKVGTAMDITSGKYFETPEGQGNYGQFENFTGGRKIIQFIDVMTDEGYIVIKDDSVNLWQLKQQYPNAKFSYHIVYENADGTTRPLGWLTEDSLDQNIQQDMGIQQQGMIDMDDVDR